MYRSESFPLSTYKKDRRFQSLGRRAIEARGKNEKVLVVLSVRDSTLGHALPSQKTITFKKSAFRSRFWLSIGCKGYSLSYYTVEV